MKYLRRLKSQTRKVKKKEQYLLRKVLERMSLTRRDLRARLFPRSVDLDVHASKQVRVTLTPLIKEIVYLMIQRLRGLLKRFL